MKWLKCFNRRCDLWLRPEAMLYCWPKSGWVIDVNGLKALREDPYLCWGFRNFISFLLTSFLKNCLGGSYFPPHFIPCVFLCQWFPISVPRANPNYNAIFLMMLSTFSYDLIGCLSKYHFYPNGFSKFISFLNDWKIEFRWFQVRLG